MPANSRLTLATSSPVTLWAMAAIWSARAMKPEDPQAVQADGYPRSLRIQPGRRVAARAQQAPRHGHGGQCSQTPSCLPHGTANAASDALEPVLEGG
jgi:hypothetical protein